MRSLHRWFLVAALAVAGVWIHSLAGSAAMLLALLEGLDEAPDVARVGGDERPPGPEAPQGPGSQTLAAAAQSDHGVLPEQIPGGDLSAAQIMRLLEGEMASDTDPAAADELLRAFGESLDSRE